MERAFVLVLIAVTLVTATPHGYGVKGGASAKAEASAVAGTFGDLAPIPLSIPSGAGYSGSFSKSSSSSFASSSASSSSSSYSFSGSGANGIAGIGSNKGCSSGTCSGIGSTAPSSNGDSQFTGANAVSAAQAKALAGVYTPCQGSNCQNGFPSEKCTSGQCPTALKGQNECSTDNCQLSSPSTQSDSGTEGSSEKLRKDKLDDDSDGSNDFAVNFNRKPGEINGQHPKKENPYDSISGCSNGKCGPTDSQHSNLGSNQNQQPAPSTYLTTPKEKPPCTTPNCNYPSQGFSLNGAPTSGLPSSYNVPLLSATNPPNTFYSSPISSGKETTYPNTENSAVAGGPCTSPNCNSTPYNIGASNIPNYNFGQQGFKNQGHCASGRCGVSSTSNAKTSNNEPLPTVTAPNYSHGGIQSNIPSVQSGCKSRDCANLPTNSGLPTYQPTSGCNGVACGDASPTGSGKTPSDYDTPVYSGGFGGSAGFLDKSSGNSAYNHGQKINGGFGTTPLQGSFDHRAAKPHELSPVSNSPFNRPAASFGLTPSGGTFGITNSNELHSNHGSTQSSSNSGSTGVLSYGKPSSAPAILGSQLSHSNTGSYGATPGSLATPIGSATHPETSGVYKPTSSNIGNNPSYHGSIDGSIQSSHAISGSNSNQGSFGITKPNVPSNYQSNSGYTGGITGATNPTFGSNGPHNKPGSSCGSANCNIHTNVNGGTDEEKPMYTGGFGGPTGLLKPNDYSIPSNTPIGSLGRTSCANGNCDPKSTSSSNPQSSLSNGHNLAAASAIASANAVAYSGGFGGPPGLLKPYDDGKIYKPAHGNIASGHSPTSNTGNSDTSSVNGKNSEPGASLPAVNPGAQAGALASATAGSYSGNNDFQNHNGATGGCNSGCGVDNLGLAQNGAGAGSIATAKSSAGANAYGIGGSFASASAHASAGSATKGGYGRK